MRLTLVCLVLMLFPSWANAEWVKYGPLKNSPEYGPVVTDVERHLPARHDYRNDADKTSWVHEGTHKINGQLRSKYQRPGFYRLYDRAFILNGHPKTTLKTVAKYVPKAYRRRSYESYCIEAQPWYNKETAFLFDEWCACLNQAVAANKLGLEKPTALENLIDIAVSSTCVAYCADDTDENLKVFLRDMWEKTLLYVGDDPLLQALATAPDAAKLYAWMKTYFGADWVVVQFEGKLNYNIGN